MTRTFAGKPSFRPVWLLAAAGFVFSAAFAAASSTPQDPDPKPPQSSARKVPEPPVKDMNADEEYAWATAAEATTQQVCSPCHQIAEITGKRHTWVEWHDVVQRMAALGLSASDEQLTTIKLYMTRYYGTVNVNTATAAELSAVLGLSSKEAAAIVDYRKAHGNFGDVAALLKVDGIDKSKIEQQPEALRFD